MATKILPMSSPRAFRILQHSQKDLYSARVEQKWSILKRNHKFRENCIRFMMGLCGKYKFNKDTLFLAIHILDQLIEASLSQLFDDFEIIAGVLVLLTTKFNEVYPVTIDQINMVTEKYYPRSTFFKVESEILTCINFEMPEQTVYSRLYNQLEPTFGKKFASDSDKQNDANSDNTDTDSSERDYKQDEHNLISKTLKAIREPESFKYGEEILFHAISVYLKKQQVKGVTIDAVKVNYIKAVLKRSFDGEKKTAEKKKSDALIPKTQVLKQKKSQSFEAIKKPRFFFF